MKRGFEKLLADVEQELNSQFFTGKIFTSGNQFICKCCYEPIWLHSEINIVDITTIKYPEWCNTCKYGQKLICKNNKEFIFLDKANIFVFATQVNNRPEEKWLTCSLIKVLDENRREVLMDANDCQILN